MLRVLRASAVASLALAATVAGAGAASAAASHHRPATCTKKVGKHVLLAKGTHAKLVVKASCSVHGGWNSARSEAYAHNTVTGNGSSHQMVRGLMHIKVSGNGGSHQTVSSEATSESSSATVQGHSR